MTRKKFAIFFITILAIVGIAFGFNLAFNTNKETASDMNTSLTPAVTNTVEPELRPTSTIQPTESILDKITILDKWIFYPVDKTTALSQDYVPANLVNLNANSISTTSSGFQMRKEVIADLKELFDDARKNNVNLKVLSPYRSYSNQVTTFNYWKSLELQKGLSDAQATIEANKSSAMPGHSEHQLGTTCDVISFNDSTLDYTSNNKNVWQWLDAHLINHGFVLSYPDGKDDKTGYISEPWHIRWVGKDVAKEIEKTNYRDPNNSNISTSYLRTIWEKIK